MNRSSSLIVWIIIALFAKFKFKLCNCVYYMDNIPGIIDYKIPYATDVCQYDPETGGSIMYMCDFESNNTLTKAVM